MAAVKIGIHLGREQALDQGAARGADCVQFFLGDPQGWKVPPPGPDAAEFVRWRKALDQLESEVPVLLENTAGGNHAMARRLDTLGRLWEHVGDTELGFCLDTCHAHAGGEELDGIVDRVKAITGRIDLVHANDSKDRAGSGRDRHENLGKGQIDLDTLVGIVQAAGAPVICETPGGLSEHAADITLLRSRVGGR
jgi:deoxyribonuclease IV